MIDINTIKLPTHFSQLGSQGESRFIPVKIYIAHTGENLNNSIFSKEVLKSMIPTLTNIPILGYVANKDNGDSDFRGHEKNIRIDGTTVNINYKTHAYGFIPEDNNAHFEVTGGKEWLVAEGYLWSRFVDAIKIFDESGGTKGQSMEVSHADGYTDRYGRVVYTSAQFEGLCILGDDVPPAMTGSVISTEFSKADFKSAFQEMLAEFSAEKGEYALATKKKDKDEAIIADEVKPGSSDATKSDKPAESSAASSASKPAETPAKESGSKADKPASTEKTEPKADKPASDSKETPSASEDKGAQDSANAASEDSSNEDETAEMACDPGKKKHSASMAKEETTSKDKEEDKDDADDADTSDDDDKDKDKDNKLVFELSLDEKSHAFIEAVRAKYFLNSDWCWLESVYDNYGIVCNEDDENENRHYYNIKYTVNADDTIQLGDKTEVFPTYLTAEEKAEVEANRTKVADLEAQLEELKAYKSNVEMSKKEQILSDNKDELTTEQVKDIKSQFTLLTPEEVEKEVAYAIFEAHKDDKKKYGQGMRAVNFSANKEGLGYGTADVLFHK